LLSSEDFTFPSPLLPLSNMVVDKNISLRQIDREILNHLSVDKSLANYEHKDIVNLRNRLNEYLNSSIHNGYIDNSTLLISNNITTNSSEITNKVERKNSNIENSNTGIIIEQSIHNSVIDNDVRVINSNVNNSNIGIEIRRHRVGGQILKSPISAKNVIIKSSVNDNNAININSNNGISIGGN
jgi:hypothetical protein